MRIVQAPQPHGQGPAWADDPAARRGAAGERLVHAALARALDDRYVLIHNLYLPGGDGDIDAVLIGPRLLVIETKTYAEERPLRVRGARWEYRSAAGQWAPCDAQPGLQAAANGRRVAYALRSARLPTYSVVPVVALVGGATCLLERPRVAVVRPPELARLAREPGGVQQSSWPALVLRALLVAGGGAAVHDDSDMTPVDDPTR